MNSKSEWNNSRIPRIIIEDGESQTADAESGMGGGKERERKDMRDKGNKERREKVLRMQETTKNGKAVDNEVKKPKVTRKTISPGIEQMRKLFENVQEKKGEMKESCRKKKK